MYKRQIATLTSIQTHLKRLFLLADDHFSEKFRNSPPKGLMNTSIHVLSQILRRMAFRGPCLSDKKFFWAILVAFDLGRPKFRETSHLSSHHCVKFHPATALKLAFAYIAIVRNQVFVRTKFEGGPVNRKLTCAVVAYDFAKP